VLVRDVVLGTWYLVLVLDDCGTCYISGIGLVTVVVVLVLAAATVK